MGRIAKGIELINRGEPHEGKKPCPPIVACAFGQYTWLRKGLRFKSYLVPGINLKPARGYQCKRSKTTTWLLQTDNYRTRYTIPVMGEEDVGVKRSETCFFLTP